MTRFERPGADARARLLAAAARAPATRPGAWARRLAWGGAFALAWMAVMQVALGVRPDWRELPMGDVGITVIALIAFALIATTAALARGGTMAGAPTERLWAAAGGLPVAIGLLIVLADPRGPSTLAGAASVPHALPCDLCVLAVGVPLIAVGLWIARGLTLTRPVLVGACLGLGAATWGHLVVRLHCPVGGAGHAFVGHLLPALPLMALGAWGMWRLDRGPSSSNTSGRKNSS